MEKNLFDSVNPRMFTIFSREDRRSNYDLLSTIFDIYTKNERIQSIEREDLVERLTAYISGRDFDHFEDEDGEEITKSSREKALYKIRQFKNAGWLEEDNAEGGFDIFYSLTDSGIYLLETFQNIIANKDHPIEYTGYFYSIYGLLKEFSYPKSKAYIEQIEVSTRNLFNALQSVTSSIKKFIENLLKNPNITPEEVLDMFVNKYQDQVILTVFNNLKGKDNPSIYTSEILSKLRELRYDNLDKIVNSIASETKNLTSEKYKELENKYSEILDNLILNFDRVDSFIDIIDRKNGKFHKSAIAKLTFLLNTRNDIDGQIVKSLKALKNVKEHADFESVIELNYSSTIDDKSTYCRTFNKDKIVTVPSNAPAIDEKEIEEAFSFLLLEDEYSKEKINEFILSILDGKKEISSSDIKIDNSKDLLKIFVSEIYSSYDDMVYTMSFNDKDVEIFGYLTKGFIIQKKGK